MADHDENHTRILIELAEISTTMGSMHDSIHAIGKDVKDQNSRVYKCEAKADVHQQMIETNEENISTQSKSLGKLSWKLGLLIGGLMGGKEIVSWLAG